MRTLVALFMMQFVLAGNLPAPTRAFGPEINSPSAHESVMHVYANGKTFLLTRSALDFSKQSHFQLDCLGAKCAMRELTHSALDTTPISLHLSRDGRMQFAVVKTKDSVKDDFGDIFAAVPSEHFHVWQKIPAPVSTDKSECCVVPISPDRFLFSSDRGQMWDIYEARRTRTGYAVTRLPDSVNSEGMEWPSFVDRKGRFLLFSSIRKGGIGGDDLYISHNVNGEWQPAVNLGVPINTEGYEDSPKMSADGKYLYFSSRPAKGGTSDVFKVPFDPMAFRRK